MKYRKSQRLAFGAFWLIAASGGWAEDKTSVIVVAGAGGEAEYSTLFAKWAGDWKQACETAGAEARTIGLDEKAADRKSTRLNSSHGGISRMPSSA